MLNRDEIIRCLGPREHEWIARCQVFAALLFVVLFVGVTLFSFDSPASQDSIASASVDDATHHAALQDAEAAP